MIYVSPLQPLGNLQACKLFADSTEELLAMAEALVIPRRWLQKAHTPYEHFELPAGKRMVALIRGAVEVDDNQVVRLIETKKASWRKVTAR